MATTTRTATASGMGMDVSSDAPTKRSAHSHANLKNLNGFSAPQPLAPITPIRVPYVKKKYRHVAAVHAQPRTSCLSHDSVEAPSFFGFRNLMVIVLSVFTSLPKWNQADVDSRWESAIDDRKF